MKHSIDWNGSTGSRFHTTKKFPDILWTRSRCALDLSQKIIHLLGTQALLLWLHNRKNICRRLTKTKYRASSSSLSIESILSIFLFFLFCRLYAVFLQLLNVLVQNEEKKNNSDGLVWTWIKTPNWFRLAAKCRNFFLYVRVFVENVCGKKGDE